MTLDEARGVLARMRLPGGKPFAMPILLPVPADAPMRAGDAVALVPAWGGDPVAVVHVRDRFRLPLDELIPSLLGTPRADHPGVAPLRALGETFAAGPVEWIAPRAPHARALTPQQAREAFRARGWRTVAAFQTRNVPHRAHELVHKTLLSLTDGLLIHPAIGPKKTGDFRDEVIVAANQALADAYYPRERALVATLPYAMRYAGPREAVHHAILRRNLGCTHFAVGRDHAGVPGFYAPEAAIALATSVDDLGISIVPVHGDHFWCPRCASVESERTCRHPESERLKFSGTLLRRALLDGKVPPPEVLRPEVAAAILSFAEPLVGARA